MESLSALALHCVEAGAQALLNKKKISPASRKTS